jgi:DNA-binding transcriptional MocR family regulator
MKQYRIQAGSGAELVEAVEEAVAAGELTPGERLPSVRRLAAEVGLSPGTIAASFAELRRRGIVVSEPRRAIRVGPAPPLGSSRRLLSVPQGARDLSRGNPDPALLPDLQAALAKTEIPVHLYGEPASVAELLAHAASQLRDEGMRAGSLCVVSGALDGIERVLDAHLRPGDRVAVENPGYAALFDLLRARGLTPEGVGVDGLGMRAGELRAVLKRGARGVIITPRGQNPTGAALDAARALELRTVLGEFPQALAIEDDHLGLLAGRRVHSTLGRSERWAATRSVAKALGPDLRLAILAGDPLTVARVQGRLQCGPGWVSHILQHLVLRLWRDPAVAALITRARRAYDQRRGRLLRDLAARGVAATGASGLNVWIGVDEEMAAVAGLLQRGWVVAAGEPYRLPGSAPAVRVTIATLSQAESRRLASDVAEVLAGARSARAG